jgi:hypothetical protein
MFTFNEEIVQYILKQNYGSYKVVYGPVDPKGPTEVACGCCAVGGIKTQFRGIFLNGFSSSPTPFVPQYRNGERFYDTVWYAPELAPGKYFHYGLLHVTDNKARHANDGVLNYGGRRLSRVDDVPQLQSVYFSNMAYWFNPEYPDERPQSFGGGWYENSGKRGGFGDAREALRRQFEGKLIMFIIRSPDECRFWNHFRKIIPGTVVHESRRFNNANYYYSVDILQMFIIQF